MAEHLCPTCGKPLAGADAPCPVCDATFSAPAPKEDSRLGSLGERYEFVKELGAGAMGSVVLARDKRLHRPVAIKRILQQTEEKQELVQRFLREARAMAMFQHPNIVRVFDVGEDQAGAYIVMDFIEGGSLESILRKEGRFSLPRALHITRQLLSALCALQEKGVVHRDIKPLNLIVQKVPEGERPILVDFGLARDPGDTSLTQVGDALGTLHYMAPEQWTDSSNVDHRADLYAVGATLYRMLTGKAPAEILRDEIPPEARALTMKLLERARDMRPASAVDALRMLAQIPGEGGGAAGPPLPAAGASAPEGTQPELPGSMHSDASASLNRAGRVPANACASCGGSLPVSVLECNACEDGRSYCSQACFARHLGEEHCASCARTLETRYVFSAEMDQHLGQQLRFCSSDCRRSYEQAHVCPGCGGFLPEESWHSEDITAALGYDAHFCSSACVQRFRQERMCGVCGKPFTASYLTCGACPGGGGFCGKECFTRHVTEQHP